MAEAAVESEMAGAVECVAEKSQKQPPQKLQQKQQYRDPDALFVETRPLRQQWLEFVLLCLCMIAWTIDCSLLPAFFHEFQVRFDVTQTSLSVLATVKGISAAIFAFPAGFIGELLPRPKLIGIGMVFWSSGLLLCAVAWSFEVIVVGRILNGVGLGVVQPLLLSLVADKSPPTKRGSAFGALFFTGSACNTIFIQVATTFADAEVAGVAGWRISIAFVAAFSALVGVGIMLWVTEPHAEGLSQRRREQGFLTVFRTNLPKVWSLFKIPTFVLILCQGAPGTAPWTIFPLLTQWLELAGFSNAQAALIFSAFGWGGAFSNLVSGFILNFVSRRFPDHGPPTLANFSVASGFPFLVLFFFILPTPAEAEASSLVAVYYPAFLAFGLSAAMCGTLNKKVFSDIVPSSIYTYVFAVDQLIEQIIGNLAPMAVGVVTDNVFHFDKDAVTEDGGNPEEAAKLGKGMFWVCNFAWAICFCVYLVMHWTYPKDRRRQLVLVTAPTDCGTEKVGNSGVKEEASQMPQEENDVPPSSEATV